MNEHNEQEYTHDLKKILSPNFTFTKRQLGIFLAILGGVSFVGLLGLDLIGGGREGGIGPTQQAALVVTAIVTLVGLSLILLGDQPA